MPRDLATATAGLVSEPNEPIRAVSLDDFLQMVFPPKEQILAPWLPTKGLFMVFAPRGVGKTHFGLGVAYAVALGGDYLCWRAPKPRKVLLIDGEMPAVALQERLATIVQNAAKEPPSGDYIRLLSSDLCEFGLPDLATEEGQREIERHLGDAELVVIDNISTLARSGRENEAESWGQIQTWALNQRRQGRSVLFIHHAGKGGEQRGTSKREDVMDTVIKLSRPVDYSPTEGARFNVEFTKSRGFTGSDAESFEAHFCDGMWTIRRPEDERSTQVISLNGAGMSQRDIAAELGMGLGSVNRIIKKARVGGAP